MQSRLDWIIENTKGKVVLDVGAATGTVHKEVARVAKESVGIDVMAAPGILKESAETFIYKPRNYFDTVLLGDCLEHIQNPGLVFGCAKQNLKPGGEVIITTPNLRYPQVFFRDSLSDYHFHGYTPKLLRQTLSEHGFKPSKPVFFRVEGNTSMGGKLFNMVLRFWPQFSMHFGMIGKK